MNCYSGIAYTKACLTLMRNRTMPIFFITLPIKKYFLRCAPFSDSPNVTSYWLEIIYFKSHYVIKKTMIYWSNQTFGWSKHPFHQYFMLNLTHPIFLMLKPPYSPYYSVYSGPWLSRLGIEDLELSPGVQHASSAGCCYGCALNMLRHSGTQPFEHVAKLGYFMGHVSFPLFWNTIRDT